MNKFIAGLRIFAAGVLILLALTTLVNLVLFATNPDTISVVNAIVGGGVIIVALAALATIQWRKGLKQWRELSNGDGT